MTDLTEKRRAAKDDVLFAYWDKKISYGQAAAQLRDLDFAQWEIDGYLDDIWPGDGGEEL